MKKLVFYSDQIIPENKQIDLQLMELIGKTPPRIGFIPSKSRPDQKYYFERKDYYAQYGADLCLNFDLDENYRAEKLKDLLGCDAIHLSGGDTGYFLNWLKKRDLLNDLKDYVEKGGVLIGTSAGAIIMTANISISSRFFPSENKPTDTSSLNLVDFEFLPHFNKLKDGQAELCRYSQGRRKVYACPDGSGILVNGNEVRFIGEILTFENGEMSK